MSIESERTSPLGGSDKNTLAIHSIRRAIVCLLLVAGALQAKGRCQHWSPEFISLEAAKPVLQGMAGSLPSELKAAGSQLDSQAWSAWVQ